MGRVLLPICRMALNGDASKFWLPALTISIDMGWPLMQGVRTFETKIAQSAA